MFSKKRHDTVTAYIFSQDFSKILLVSKRVSGRHMPPGGHVEKGETYMEAVTREIYEETGIQINKLSKKHFDSILDNESCAYRVCKPVQDEEFVVLERVNSFHYHIDHIYCFVLLGDFELEPIKSIEIAKAAWFNVSDIKAETFYPNVFDTISFFSGRCKNE